MAGDVSAFLREVLAYCVSIRSIWLIGARAEIAAVRNRQYVDWDLLVFADPGALGQLRRSAHLHRSDVRFLVVTDGEHFERAWGNPEKSGSLFGWGWRRASASEAFYDEALWDKPAHNGVVRRLRRRALRLWEEP